MEDVSKLNCLIESDSFFIFGRSPASVLLEITMTSVLTDFNNSSYTTKYLR